MATPMVTRCQVTSGGGSGGGGAGVGGRGGDGTYFWRR